MSPARPIHVTPFGPRGKPHSASMTCQCSPISIGIDMATAAPVYRHRNPPIRPITARDRQAAADFASFEDMEDTDGR